MWISRFYVIIILVVTYTVVILGGLYAAINKARRTAGAYKEVLFQMISEIKDIIKEEDKMTHPLTQKDTLTQKEPLTLATLIHKKAVDSEYAEVVDLLAHLAKTTFENYNFLIQKSPDETKEAHFMQLRSAFHESPQVHKHIFEKSIDYGIDYDVLVQKFNDKLRTGEIISCGEDVVIITDDGTGMPASGVSQINSGIEGGEISFNVSFVSAKNYEAWAETNIKKDEGDE
ncbi:hypothetical protein [Bacillus phage phiAGATE]|uniref:Uncharacterized protein n=1 Tax=Bacillus phage phiAGATE TaxID=1204533 RepID=L0L8B3_9CAUD|nr:hypothetical protein G380_gp194 [Bacillus phage phiAGATE]AGB62629.1 hypothetical protein [Bacillus phage phiAGATE]